MVGAKALSVFVDNFTQTPDCNIGISYRLFVVGYNVIPPFVKVGGMNILAISTNNVSDAGNYTIGINGSVLSNNKEFTASLYIPLQIYTLNLGPPYF